MFFISYKRGRNVNSWNLLHVHISSKSTTIIQRNFKGQSNGTNTWSSHPSYNQSKPYSLATMGVSANGMFLCIRFMVQNHISAVVSADTKSLYDIGIGCDSWSVTVVIT